MAYKIAIVDDRSQNIYSLKEKINYAGDVEIVFTARNGKDFLEQMKHTKVNDHPQVVLMDVDMPVMNGIDAVRYGHSLYEHVKFIMLTVFDDDDKLFEAIKAGASGYLLKEERVDMILQSIKEVIEKEGAPMSPRIARKALNLLTTASVDTSENAIVATDLSAREMDILKELVNGHDYRQIAAILYISPNTVRKHISNIYEKLHVTSKAQVIKLAIKNKFV